MQRKLSILLSAALLLPALPPARAAEGETGSVSCRPPARRTRTTLPPPPPASRPAAAVRGMPVFSPSRSLNLNRPWLTTPATPWILTTPRCARGRWSCPSTTPRAMRRYSCPSGRKSQNRNPKQTQTIPLPPPTQALSRERAKRRQAPSREIPALRSLETPHSQVTPPSLAILLSL